MSTDIPDSFERFCMADFSIGAKQHISHWRNGYAAKIVRLKAVIANRAGSVGIARFEHILRDFAMCDHEFTLKMPQRDEFIPRFLYARHIGKFVRVENRAAAEFDYF